MEKETKNKIIIKDESMDPFFIQADNSSYNVCEHTTSKTGNNRIRTYSFHTSLETALQAIVQRKVKLKIRTTTLVEYINNTKTITQEIADAVYTIENIKLK